MWLWLWLRLWLWLKTKRIDYSFLVLLFSVESSFFLWTQSAHKITSINNNSIKIWYYNEINYNVINIIIKKYNREREERRSPSNVNDHYKKE